MFHGALHLEATASFGRILSIFQNLIFVSMVGKESLPPAGSKQILYLELFVKLKLQTIFSVPFSTEQHTKQEDQSNFLGESKYIHKAILNTDLTQIFFK